LNQLCNSALGEGEGSVEERVFSGLVFRSGCGEAESGGVLEALDDVLSFILSL
jgi:hypothetical protein